jgi:predicted chitinase
MRFSHKTFFDGYRREFGRLSQPVVAAIDAVLTAMEADPQLKDVRYAAYQFATMRIETAGTYAPITERGGRSYFLRYDITSNPRKARELGNDQPGDGYTYRGRGFVQITGKTNYRKLSKVVGLDLVASPDLALRPDVAYTCMSFGMRTGMFTGKRLSDYISGARCDYRNARRIINGTDRAAEIAGYAQQFERILRSALIPADVAESLPSVSSPESQAVAAEEQPAALAASEGEPAPTQPAKADEAIVGGRPSDAPIEVPAPAPAESAFQQIETKVKGWWAGGVTGVGTALAATWGWLTQANTMLVIGLIAALVLVGASIAIAIFWLKNRREQRAAEAAEKAAQRAHELSIEQLKIAADPSKYNAVVKEAAPA